MNKYAKDMLMRRRDMRNPYGSKGGYVTSDRAMNDMAYGRSDYNRGRDYADYARNDYARGGYGENRDYGFHEEMGFKPVEAMGYFTGYYGGEDGRGKMNYGYPYREDYGYDYNYDYGYDYAHEGAHKLSRREIKKWEKDLEGADGTKGPKWQMEQVKQVAQQHGIKFDDYSPETFTAVMNALYADYCKVLGADPAMYAKLTKAWLEDDDFDGEPEEKAMLYYKCIVSKDD